MKLLEQRIVSDGKVLPGGILKVDGFLNHRADPALLFAMAEETKRLFADKDINKILTVEASGIALAVMVGYVMGCPLVFAKKHKSKNISDSVYSASVDSFTHCVTNTIIVSKEYLSASDRILIVDDFLATGAAIVGLTQLVEQAGGKIMGACVAVEKEFQGGGNLLRAQGMQVEALAKIKSMDEHGLCFC